MIYINENYAKAIGGINAVQEKFDDLGLNDGENDNSASLESSVKAGNVISDNYLGAMVLEFIGYGGNDVFFSYLNELRRSVPVYRLPASLGSDEKLGDEISSELHNWTYYRIKY